MVSPKAALLCRSVRTDLPGFPGPSFLGVFGGVTASRFPLRLKGCIYVVQVADWEPRDEFCVEVGRGGETVFGTEPKRFAIAGRASPAWIEVPLDGAVLPDEGTYTVAMRVGADLVVERSLLAVLLTDE